MKSTLIAVSGLPVVMSWRIFKDENRLAQYKYIYLSYTLSALFVAKKNSN
jgi:uncharacterized membrane protein